MIVSMFFGLCIHVVLAILEIPHRTEDLDIWANQCTNLCSRVPIFQDDFHLSFALTELDSDRSTIVAFRVYEICASTPESLLECFIRASRNVKLAQVMMYGDFYLRWIAWMQDSLPSVVILNQPIPAFGTVTLPILIDNMHGFLQDHVREIQEWDPHFQITPPDVMDILHPNHNRGELARFYNLIPACLQISQVFIMQYRRWLAQLKRLLQILQILNPDDLMSMSDLISPATSQQTLSKTRFQLSFTSRHILEYMERTGLSPRISYLNVRRNDALSPLSINQHLKSALHNLQYILEIQEVLQQKHPLLFCPLQTQKKIATLNYQTTGDFLLTVNDYVDSRNNKQNKRDAPMQLLRKCNTSVSHRALCDAISILHPQLRRDLVRYDFTTSLLPKVHDLAIFSKIPDSLDHVTFHETLINAKSQLSVFFKVDEKENANETAFVIADELSFYYQAYRAEAPFILRSSIGNKSNLLKFWDTCLEDLKKHKVNWTFKKNFLCNSIQHSSEQTSLIPALAEFQDAMIEYLKSSQSDTGIDLDDLKILQLRPASMLGDSTFLIGTFTFYENLISKYKHKAEEEMEVGGRKKDTRTESTVKRFWNRLHHNQKESITITHPFLSGFENQKLKEAMVVPLQDQERAADDADDVRGCWSPQPSP